jgi:hypothetical protein
VALPIAQKKSPGVASGVPSRVGLMQCRTHAIAVCPLSGCDSQAFGVKVENVGSRRLVHARRVPSPLSETWHALKAANSVLLALPRSVLPDYLTQSARGTTKAPATHPEMRTGRGSHFRNGGVTNPSPPPAVPTTVFLRA